MRRLAPVLFLAALLASGCGGGDSNETKVVRASDLAPLHGAKGEPAPPAATAAISRVKLNDASETRIGYVNDARLDELGPDAADYAKAVRAGDPVLPPATGEPRNDNAINPYAQANAMGCLGDPVVLTMLGPETVGHDAAIGVALRRADGSDHVEVLLCGAPRYLRLVHKMVSRLKARYGDADPIEETEMGEREMARAVLPLDAVNRDDLLDMLRGGSRLAGLIAD